MSIFTDNDATLIAKPSGAITDTAGNQWTISNGRVLINGQTDWSTARVVALVYSQGQVWQENADGNWWGKTSPTAPWSPTYGTRTAPTPDGGASTNVVTMNSYDTPIIDDNRHVWSIVDSQVAVDGVIDPTTQNVTELAYANGLVWQENADGLWWSKATPTDGWNPPYGTVNSPVPNIGRLWEGGNGSITWGDHWEASGVPQAGDTAVISQGTVLLDPGYGLNVNFAFVDNGSGLTVNQNGGFLIGQLSGTGNIYVESPTSQTTSPPIVISADSVSLTPGNNLVLTDFQYSGQFILRGNSSLTQANLTIARDGINHAAYAPIENDGLMFLDGSTFKAGAVTGNGALLLVNGSSAQIASGSETLVNLTSGSLEIGGSFNPPDSGIKNLAGQITEFGIDSSVRIDGTQAVLEVVKHYSPDAKELFMISADNRVVADLRFYGGASTLYATNNAGAVVISAQDNGYSLPIIDV